MSLAYWRDSCKVNHPQIDHEHATLLSLLESVYRAILLEQRADAVQDILEALLNAMFLHCETEENLMEAYGYPDRAAHIADHEQILDAIFNIRLTAEQPNAVLSLDTIYDLANWMTRHIWEQDLPMVRFIQQRQKSEGLHLSRDQHTGCLIYVA